MTQENDRKVIELVERLPCRLDRFWKARLLKPHHSEEEFLADLSLCFSCGNGEEREFMDLLRQRGLLDSYLITA